MRAILLVLAVAMATGVAGAAQAPKLSIASLRDLPMVERTPYDTSPSADAARAVDAALGRARAAHKRVLIDMGGNWCPDCLVLANLMQLPEMKRFLSAHFEIVAVDVGRFDKNLAIPARYGITGRLAGVPAVLVVDPGRGGDGRVLNRSDVFALSDARAMSAQAIADWLAGWAR